MQPKDLCDTEVYWRRSLFTRQPSRESEHKSQSCFPKGMGVWDIDEASRMVSGEGKVDGRQGRELVLDALADTSGLPASAHSYWKHFASCRSRVNRPIRVLVLGLSFGVHGQNCPEPARPWGGS